MKKTLILLILLMFAGSIFAAENDIIFVQENASGGLVEKTLPADEADFFTSLPDALQESEVDADLKTLSLPASTTISTFGATLVDDVNAAAVLSTLAMGSGDSVEFSYITANIQIDINNGVSSQLGLDASTQGGYIIGVNGLEMYGASGTKFLDYDDAAGDLDILVNTDVDTLTVTNLRLDEVGVGTDLITIQGAAGSARTVTFSNITGDVVMTAGTQTIGGSKNFTSEIQASGGINVTGGNYVFASSIHQNDSGGQLIVEGEINNSGNSVTVNDSLTINETLIFQPLNPYSTVTNDGLDVNNESMIMVVTSGGSVTIGGFTNGVEGQILHIVVTDATNNTTLEHNEATGNQDIFLSSGADETLIASYGGWTLICDGSNWYEVGQ